jgi:hypothetical protein
MNFHFASYNRSASAIKYVSRRSARDESSRLFHFIWKDFVQGQRQWQREWVNAVGVPGGFDVSITLSQWNEPAERLSRGLILCRLRCQLLLKRVNVGHR